MELVICVSTYPFVATPNVVVGLFATVISPVAPFTFNDTVETPLTFEIIEVLAPSPGLIKFTCPLGAAVIANKPLPNNKLAAKVVVMSVRAKFAAATLPNCWAFIAVPYNWPP